MRLGVLFSGGKDSTYVAWLAKREGHELICLISILSENQESFMFHTPSIKQTKAQAKVMNLPLIFGQTKGEKEKELVDLERTIKLAQQKHGIEGIVTGALASNYQAKRIQKICDETNLKCLNPLWQKDEIKYLEELVENKFKVIITGVFAYPLDSSWLGREIDSDFIKEVRGLKEKYKIHPAGEGGEFETFVLNCPLFEKELKIKEKKISGEKHSWKIELDVE